MKRNDGTPISRRRFLGAAAAGGAVVLPGRRPAERKQADPERAKLEALVERYGSELGALRKVS